MIVQVTWKRQFMLIMTEINLLIRMDTPVKETPTIYGRMVSVDIVQHAIA